MRFRRTIWSVSALSLASVAQGRAQSYYSDQDDDGHAWLENSTDGGSAWSLGNDGEPLDYNFTNGTSPGSKDPSLSYCDKSGYDALAAAIEEPGSSGTKGDRHQRGETLKVVTVTSHTVTVSLRTFP